MKFFAINEPYYALLKAKDVSRARDIYMKTVADGTEGELLEIAEVPAINAAALYSRTKDENFCEVPIDEVVSDLTNNKEMILISEVM